ncbi:hypothetical protein ETAA8_63850 [Anatilimnocola aggregata]|uniref:Resolvase/invertase-type recombinase catalytic domain-containing protein n=1 Tax=Anatilimnocola aggregata TaxID=2528021 RepID=A0A517YLY3_9BACT|nr:IS607 family transposase [Anatilimnocola aggregata]QDU31232.1 hypothetical protein ETAA8_63850 [Anatilimnocola aggregata]
MSGYQSINAESGTATEWLSIGELSRRFKVHVNTARNAANAGRLRSYRLNAASFDGKSHRRFRLEDVHEWLGLEQGKSVQGDSNEPTRPAVLLVARVSTSSQKADLQRQVERLEAFAKEKWGKDGCTIHKYVRTTSGLNYNSSVLTKMVRDIIDNKFNNGFLIITYRERLVRQGFDLIKTICESKGITIIQTETEESVDYQAELIQDILSLSHVYNCRMFGARGNKNRVFFRELPQTTIDLICDLRAKGFSLREIHRKLVESKSNVCSGGRKFGLQLVIRVLKQAKPLNDTSLANPRSGGSFEKWLKTKLRVGGRGAKITRAKILSAYSVHCEQNGERRVSRKLCLEQLSKHVQKLGVEVTENGESVLYTGMNLIPHSITTAKAT